MDISVEALQEAISIRRQIDTLEKRLSSMLAPGRRVRAIAALALPHMSAATRAKLAAAATARWARLKAGTKIIPTKMIPVKKGGITPAGRRRLSQLMKARWAARRKAAAKK